MINRFEEPFFLEKIHVDPQKSQLTYKSKSIEVPHRAMRLLICLCQHPMVIVDKTTLMKAVWPDTIVSHEALAKVVQLLRDILKVDPDFEYVKTVRGQGYQLMVHPQELPGKIPRPLKAYGITGIVLLVFLASFLLFKEITLFSDDNNATPKLMLTLNLGTQSNPLMQRHAKSIYQSVKNQLQDQGVSLVGPGTAQYFSQNPQSSIDDSLGITQSIELQVQQNSKQQSVTLHFADNQGVRHQETTQFNLSTSTSDVVTWILKQISSEIDKDIDVGSDSNIRNEDYNLGVYHYRFRTKESLSNAISYFDNVIASRPAAGDVHAYKAMSIYYLMNFHEFILPEFAKEVQHHSNMAKELAPNSSITQLLSATEALYQGDTVRAKLFAKNIVEQAPSYYEAYELLASIHYIDREYTEFERYQKQASEADPYNENIMLLEANVLALKGFPEKAEALIAKLLTNAKQNTQEKLHRYLAYFYRINGEAASAHPHSLQAYNLAPESPQNIMTLLWSYSDLGQDQKFEKLLQRHPKATQYSGARFIAYVQYCRTSEFEKIVAIQQQAGIGETLENWELIYRDLSALMLNEPPSEATVASLITRIETEPYYGVIERALPCMLDQFEKRGVTVPNHSFQEIIQTLTRVTSDNYKLPLERNLLQRLRTINN